MAVEAKRGCGYRKAGGLYLVGGGFGIPCDRLPVEIGGTKEWFRSEVRELAKFPSAVLADELLSLLERFRIRQTRGWSWVNVELLMEGNHMVAPPYNHNDSHPEPVPCKCHGGCPLCKNVKGMGEAGLLWVGAQFYPTIEHFEAEAKALGVSRRITAVPRDFEMGKTWLLFAHPRGVIKATGELKAAYVPAIFRVWRPDRLEKIYDESQRGSAEQMADEKRGIQPIFVPDNDPDHHGSVYDKPDAEEGNDAAPATQPLDFKA